MFGWLRKTNQQPQLLLRDTLFGDLPLDRWIPSRAHEPENHGLPLSTRGTQSGLAVGMTLWRSSSQSSRKEDWNRDTTWRHGRRFEPWV